MPSATRTAEDPSCDRGSFRTRARVSMIGALLFTRLTMNRFTLAILLPALLAACASTSGTGTPPQVRPGIDVLSESPPAELQQRRVGLITNHTGVTRGGTSSIDVLAGMPTLQLVALFAPEHGIRGVAADGEIVSSSVDQRTGLPIHSLYGETRKPTPEMLAGIDALLFDIQDVGARQYTYVSTMALAMEAAREAGIPFYVLDRPNPIGGIAVEGNLLDPAFATFVGMYPIPTRHGLTAGELAGLINTEFGVGANLSVIRAEGWSRDLWYDHSGLPWINPSPNIRRLEAAIHYPGTVFLEGTNLLERGTDLPFEQTGAPWLDAAAIVNQMNAMRLPGIRFEAIALPVESTSRKYPGETVQGIRYHLTDRNTYRPVRTSLLLIDAIRRRHPEQFQWSGTMDRLSGTDQVRQAIESGTLLQLIGGWEADEQRFREMRQPYLLY
jgi:uncharacterized protein YbbC (DUF1343 family)